MIYVQLSGLLVVGICFVVKLMLGDLQVVGFFFIV